MLKNFLKLFHFFLLESFYHYFKFKKKEDAKANMLLQRKITFPMIFLYSILNFSCKLKVKAIELNTRGLSEYLQN